MKKIGRKPKTNESTFHSTKAPIMYATKMPNAREEAERDPNRPLMPGEEHSLTYIHY